MVAIKICPKCKNSTVKLAFNVSGWLAPAMYRCKECEYVGYYYLEVDLEENIIEKDENPELYEDREESLIKRDEIKNILTNLCENCGSKLRKNSNFCNECGFNRELGEIL